MTDGTKPHPCPKPDHQGYVSLQDDLSIPPPPPAPPAPNKASKATPTGRPEPQRNSSLSAELHRKFMELFGGTPQAAILDEPETEESFEPRIYFFYGSLQDPEVLQKVLNAEKTPILTRAKVKGFKVKMWGIYPALVPDESADTTGMIWKLESIDELTKLKHYETSAYTISSCEVETDDGEVLHDCRTFGFNGGPGSPELREGSFDMDRFKTYFKSPLLTGTGSWDLAEKV